MSETIDSREALESVIGKAPPAIDLKVIDHIDATARAWLASAPLMFAGLGGAGRIDVTLGGGAAGFAAAADPSTLQLPLDRIDDPSLLVPGASFGSLFLVPCIGETLRINGRVAGVADGMARIAVEECYVHCAKALTEHPTEMGGAALFNVEQPDRMAGVDSYAFRRDATIYNQGKAADNNLGEDLLGGMSQLHFGWFGGGIVKIVYFGLGLGLTYLAASGVNIWLARRRDKGRPAPGWERAWGATVWGQPAAIAGAAVASVAMGETAIAIATWAALSVIFWLLAFRFDSAWLGRAGRIATGALMLLAAAAHLALRGGATSADTVAWIVNAGFLIGGLALLAPDFRRKAVTASPAATA